MELLARGGEDFHLVAQVDFILLKHLEGLTDASRPHFEVKVFFVAVESLLDETRERHAVFDPHPFGMVDFHQDFVTIDRQVGEEIVFILEPLVDKLLYYGFTDHSVGNYCCCYSGGRRRPSNV